MRIWGLFENRKKMGRSRRRVSVDEWKNILNQGLLDYNISQKLIFEKKLQDDPQNIKIKQKIEWSRSNIEYLSVLKERFEFKKLILEQKSQKIWIIVNPNHLWYEFDDEKIVNPQQIIVIDIEKNIITRYPISLWRRWVMYWDKTYKGVNWVRWSTAQWMFQIQGAFDVTENLYWWDYIPATYYDATHSRVKEPYKLSQKYYWSNVWMVYKMIALDYMSFMRWQFIHGTNSRDEIWKAGSNGCIRMLCEHLDDFISSINTWIAYRVNKNGDFEQIENNKTAFSHTQIEDKNVNIEGGTNVFIMDSND